MSLVYARKRWPVHTTGSGALLARLVAEHAGDAGLGAGAAGLFARAFAFARLA